MMKTKLSKEAIELINEFIQANTIQIDGHQTKLNYLGRCLNREKDQSKRKEYMIKFYKNRMRKDRLCELNIELEKVLKLNTIDALRGALIYAAGGVYSSDFQNKLIERIQCFEGGLNFWV
jgi:molecular chaperone GrpE (heat shock protein)